MHIQIYRHKSIHMHTIYTCVYMRVANAFVYVYTHTCIYVYLCIYTHPQSSRHDPHEPSGSTLKVQPRTERSAMMAQSNPIIKCSGFCSPRTPDSVRSAHAGNDHVRVLYQDCWVWYGFWYLNLMQTSAVLGTCFKKAIFRS